MIPETEPIVPNTIYRRDKLRRQADPPFVKVFSVTALYVYFDRLYDGGRKGSFGFEALRRFRGTFTAVAR